jgi:hypothetical protein
MGMGSRSIKLARKHGTAKSSASGRKSKKISSCTNWEKRRHRKRKISNLCAGRKVPCWSRGRRRRWAPPGTTTPWVQPSRLAGEAVVMAAGRGGGEGRERRWRPSLRPKRKRWWRRDGRSEIAPGEFYKQRTEEGMCGGRSGDKKTRWESESPMDAAASGRCPPACSSLSMGFCIARSVTCELWLRSVDALTDSIGYMVPSGQSVRVTTHGLG